MYSWLLSVLMVFSVLCFGQEQEFSESEIKPMEDFDKFIEARNITPIGEELLEIDKPVKYIYEQLLPVLHKLFWLAQSSKQDFAPNCSIDGDKNILPYVKIGEKSKLYMINPIGDALLEYDYYCNPNEVIEGKREGVLYNGKAIQSYYYHDDPVQQQYIKKSVSLSEDGRLLMILLEAPDEMEKTEMVAVEVYELDPDSGIPVSFGVYGFPITIFPWKQRLTWWVDSFMTR